MLIFIIKEDALSENCLEARTKSENQRQTVFFKKCFSKGTHKWTLHLEGLDESNGNCIQFGVLSKDDFDHSDDVNDYQDSDDQNTWSVSSTNYFKNSNKRMRVTGQCASYQNLKFDCILNFDDGKFIIEGNGIKAEANDLKNKELYPFVTILNQGGCVKII